MSTIVHGILSLKSKDRISLKPGKKLNNLKRQYGIPQLCNDYNILAITVYIGEKTSSCTSTGALAIPDYASRQLNFSCFMFWVTRRLSFAFFVTWNFRDPFSKRLHNTYILVMFQSHKKTILVDITFGLTDLSLKKTHGISQLHFHKKKPISQAIVLRIELNSLLKSNRFKYLRKNSGSKKERKTIFVIFYSR